MDPSLKNWVFSKTDVVCVEYHIPAPYPADLFYILNAPAQDYRADYYNVLSAPKIKFDGPGNPGFDSIAWEARYAAHKAEGSDAQIEIEADYVPSKTGAGSGVVSTMIIAEASIPGDWRFRLVVTESDVDTLIPGGNGINPHHHIFREFLPDTLGTVVSFPGPYPDTVIVNLPFTVEPDWVDSNVAFVGFLQNETTKVIEQGGERRLRDVFVGIEEGVPSLQTDRLDPVRPNPFNPVAAISFNLAKVRNARVVVFDAAGRRVAVLLDERLPAGNHEVIWFGETSGGNQAPSGTYFVRLENREGPPLVRKAVLIR